KDLLYGLKQRALRFDNFKDFSHDYSISVNHGIYYHLTDNPDWTYRTDIGSRDMSSIAGGQILDPGSFMVTADLDYWDSTYNRDGDDKLLKNPPRPYVAIIELSNLEQINPTVRGFGHEIYLFPDGKQSAKDAVVVKVVTREQAQAFARRYDKKKPGSEEELRELWEEAHKKKTEAKKKLGIREQREEDSVRRLIPKPRNGWTKGKIRKHLLGLFGRSETGQNNF